MQQIHLVFNNVGAIFIIAGADGNCYIERDPGSRGSTAATTTTRPRRPGATTLIPSDTSPVNQKDEESKSVLLHFSCLYDARLVLYFYCKIFFLMMKKWKELNKRGFGITKTMFQKIFYV